MPAKGDGGDTSSPPPSSPSLITQTIPVTQGWNWVSMNVWNNDMSAARVLGTLNNASGAYISDQDEYADFQAQANPPRWAGNLKDFKSTTMYKMRSKINQGIAVSGWAMEMGQSHNWPIYIGWNWLPYHRQSTMSVADGMIDFPFTSGDILKSQDQFAHYYGPTVGWAGSLENLQPGKGYMLKTQAAGAAWFDPDKPRKRRHLSQVAKENSLVAPPAMQPATTVPKMWSVFEASNFSDSLSLTAVVIDHNKRPLNTGSLAAFTSSGSLRGVQTISHSFKGGPGVFFLSIFANCAGEQITFKYAPDANTIVELDDAKLTFHADDVINFMHPFTLLTAPL